MGDDSDVTAICLEPTNSDGDFRAKASREIRNKERVGAGSWARPRIEDDDTTA